MAKTAEGSAKKATKRKQDQYILLKVQILTWLLEKHITMPPVGEITLERMTDTRKTIKDTKNIEEHASTSPYKNYFQYIVQYVMGRII